MEEFDFWVEMTITVKRRIPTSVTAKTREGALERVWKLAEWRLFDDELKYESGEETVEEVTYEVK